MADDLYAVLGVERSASQAEIRAAYRRLARAHHPDHAPGSEAEMVVLNLAYGILGNPERRRRYDASLPAADARLPTDATLAADASLAADAGPPGAAPDEPPWSAEDLDAHADDWRQMLEEERSMWERLLAAQPASDPSPGRASIAAALAQTRQAQLELENAIRARAGLSPLSTDAFEAQRTASLAATPRPPAGCLSLLLFGLGTKSA